MKQNLEQKLNRPIPNPSVVVGLDAVILLFRKLWSIAVIPPLPNFHWHFPPPSGIQFYQGEQATNEYLLKQVVFLISEYFFHSNKSPLKTEKLCYLFVCQHFPCSLILPASWRTEQKYKHIAHGRKALILFHKQLHYKFSCLQLMPWAP